MTWGKGRYGRLGHADSEDQLKPKVVEMLLGYRAVDIACGSGDAQTLCITDDGKKVFCSNLNILNSILLVSRQRLVVGRWRLRKTRTRRFGRLQSSYED